MDDQNPTTENQNSNSESELFKQEIEKIRDDYKNAKRILQNVQEFNVRFEELKTLFNSENDGVEVNVKRIKDRFNEIEGTRDKTQNSLSEIIANIQKIKGNIEIMDAAYAQFSEIKGKISGVSGEIDTLLSTTKSLQKDIEKIKSESQQILDNIKKNFIEEQEKIKNMQTAYQDFLTIKSKIDDEKTGLKAILNGVQDLYKKSVSVNKDIQNFRDESKGLLDNIKNNKNDSDKLKVAIEENLLDAQNKKDQIQKITGIIVDSGFANAFQKRAAGLSKGYKAWGIILLIGIILLSSLVYVLFHGHLDGEIPDLNNTIYRLSLTSPLLLLVGFSMKQYSKERNLNEKYEFKAATATVIRSHVEFLIKTFNNGEAVANFALDTFKTIYKEPYSNEQKQKNSPQNTDPSEIENDGIIDSIQKELATVIPDKEILGKVLDIIDASIKK